MISIYVWQFLYQCHHWHLPFYRNISDYNGLSFTHIFDTQFCLCKVSSSFSLFLSSLSLQIIFSINLNFDLSLLLCFISTHLGRENEREREEGREKIFSAFGVKNLNYLPPFLHLPTYVGRCSIISKILRLQHNQFGDGLPMSNLELSSTTKKRLDKCVKRVRLYVGT